MNRCIKGAGCTVGCSNRGPSDDKVRMLINMQQEVLFPPLMIAGAISSHYGNYTRCVLENLVPRGDN